jgi:hypothetical protein
MNRSECSIQHSLRRPELPPVILFNQLNDCPQWHGRSTKFPWGKYTIYAAFQEFLNFLRSLNAFHGKTESNRHNPSTDWKWRPSDWITCTANRVLHPPGIICRVTTGCTTEKLGLHSRQGQEIFLFSSAATSLLDTGKSFLRVKASGKWNLPMTI